MGIRLTNYKTHTHGHWRLIVYYMPVTLMTILTLKVIETTSTMMSLANYHIY